MNSSQSWHVILAHSHHAEAKQRAEEEEHKEEEMISGLEWVGSQQFQHVPSAVVELGKSWVEFVTDQQLGKDD